jgi:peroxiredoxin
MLEAGTPAPDFTLKDLSGNPHSLSETLKKGPVLLAFFKISCPVCQFTFPFIERIFERYGGGAAQIWGISQDDAADTNDFCKEFELTFTAFPDGDGYPVSNLYRITNVPSLFFVEPDGTIGLSVTGFSKKDLAEISQKVAAANRKQAVPLFAPSDIVPDYKPG